MQLALLPERLHKPTGSLINLKRRWAPGGADKIQLALRETTKKEENFQVVIYTSMLWQEENPTKVSLPEGLECAGFYRA